MSVFMSMLQKFKYLSQDAKKFKNIFERNFSSKRESGTSVSVCLCLSYGTNGYPSVPLDTSTFLS